MMLPGCLSVKSIAVSFQRGRKAVQIQAHQWLITKNICSFTNTNLATLKFSRRLPVRNFPALSFHSTTFILAKKDKEKKNKQQSENIDVSKLLPDTKSLEKAMEARIDRMVDELSKLRAGKAGIDMFSHIRVDVNNGRIPISELGQITIKSPTKIAISVFDPSLTISVSNAIRDGGMGLNPTSDGNQILITVPKPSAEAREALAKLVGKAAEKVKGEIRNIRKDAMDALKKLKGSISEDDTRRMSKDVRFIFCLLLGVEFQFISSIT